MDKQNRWKMLNWQGFRPADEKTGSSPEPVSKIQKFKIRLRMPLPQKQFYLGGGKFLDR